MKRSYKHVHKLAGRPASVYDPLLLMLQHHLLCMAFLKILNFNNVKYILF
jgi:hypothetical protein